MSKATFYGLGFSCGVPFPDGTRIDVPVRLRGDWSRGYSAIPAEVYTAWFTGVGPQPVAWLGCRVAYDQGLDMVRRDTGRMTRSPWADLALPIPDAPYWMAVADRRLPKGEREPDPDFLPFLWSVGLACLSDEHPPGFVEHMTTLPRASSEWPDGDTL